MAMARGAAVASAMAVNSMGGGSRSLLGGLRGMSTHECADVRRRRRCRHPGDLALGRPRPAGDVRFPAGDHERQRHRRAAARGQDGRRGESRAGRSEAGAAPGGARAETGHQARTDGKAGPEPAAPPIAAAPPAPAAVPDFDPPAAVSPAPAYVPPVPEYTPPAPAYTPPAPAYVPPVPQVPAVQPEPRLRDKIIERIPIINRFHDPQPMYPTQLAAAHALYMARKANVHRLFS